MLVNGEPGATLSASDRGLAYGDGVFETIRVLDGCPLMLARHLARLELGCERLGIPSVTDLIRDDLDAALADSPRDAVAKLLVTRGAGTRGYAAPDQPVPTRIVSVAEYVQDDLALVEGISVSVSHVTLGRNVRLAGIKHLNRLEQVLAASELPDGDVEGLMCDEDGQLVEGTRSNVFAVIDGSLQTPLLDRCGVAGILRDEIIEHHAAGVGRMFPDTLLAATEVFMCNSVFGIYPVSGLRMGVQTRVLPVGPVTRTLQQWVHEQLGLPQSP